MPNKSIAYTQPPTWFTKSPRNKDAVLELTKRGWVATFPNGRTEIVVGMKNVPEEFLKGAKPTAKSVVKDEPKKEESKEEKPVEEIKEEPKQENKKKSKKSATE